MNSAFQPFNSFPTSYFPEHIRRVYANNAQLLKLFPSAALDFDFSKPIAQKSQFDTSKRKVLVAELLQQYGDLAKGKVKENIIQLADNKAFTVTTGQQIHLMLGPMYVIYKIITAINLSKKLKAEYPEFHFVPLFWMASEDHDFAEINHFTLFGKTFTWNSNQTGPVGRFSTQELQKLKEEAYAAFPTDTKVKELLGDLFGFYENATSLANATRAMINHYFQEDGLVVLDPDSKPLKEQFAAIMATELEHDTFNPAIQKQTESLKGIGIKPQISPRKTNLFLITTSGRERLDRTATGFKTAETEVEYTLSQLLDLLKTDPDLFSPNVALRPIYQEQILPNLAYIAGPGEYNYWLQLKLVFEQAKLQVPSLILRNSCIISDSKSYKWMGENKLKIDDLIVPYKELKELYINNLKGSDPLAEIFIEIKSKFESINSALFKAHSSALQTLKPQSDKYLRDLQMEMKRQNENLLLNHESSADFGKLTKLKARNFNETLPQDRELNFVEIMAQSADILIDMKLLPDPILSPLVVYWR